jgi:hypothetical protein
MTSSASVRFTPTPEQASDPLLAACFRAKATEAQVIAEQHAELVSLRARFQRYMEASYVLPLSQSYVIEGMEL